MKLIVASTLLALGLGVSGLASANPIYDTLNSLQFGLTGTQTNYAENITGGSPSDVEHGFTPGFHAAVSGTPAIPFVGHLYTRLSYDQSEGNINYSWGQVRTLDSAHFYNIGAEVGKPFFFGRDMAVIPYVDGGYRNWSRNMQGVGGYNEVYQNEYAGLGVRSYYALSNRFVLGANLNVNLVTGGSVDAYINQMDVNAPFGDSASESIGLSANYRLNPALGLYADADYSHLDYTGGPAFVDGTPVDAYEPSSQTNQFSVGAGVKVYF
jgi:hypothetical protein